MGLTSDRHQGPEYLARAIFEDAGDGGPAAASQLVYSAGNFLAQDASETYNLRRPWMNIFEGPAYDVPGKTIYCATTYVPGMPIPSTVSYYSDSAMTKLMATQTYTYSATVKVLPVTVIYRRYAADGVTVTAAATDTITYTNGVFESGRIRAFS